MENKEINEGIQLLMFIDAMNLEYYSPKEIEYRIPPVLKNKGVVELITQLRSKKSEPIFLLKDQQQQNFTYWLTPKLQKLTHEIDTQRSRWREGDASSLVLEEMLKDSLIDEAFYSSWIEGARTTKRKAEELVAKKAKPETQSERMVLNNFKTMEFLVSHLNQPMDEMFLCKLHQIVTKDTLDLEDAPYVGRYREDAVYVKDQRTQEIIYTPPAANQVSTLMRNLYDFVNSDQIDSFFMHPVIRAGIIHFYTVYVHPFVDGNGRVARALMYYYLLKHGYDFMKYFSISKAIADQPKAYYQAILNSELLNSDLNYFLIFSTATILNAIQTIEIEKKKQNLVVGYFQKIQQDGIIFNDRQERLLKLLLKSNASITLKKYQKIYKVVYETARTDLANLVDQGILIKEQKGKEFFFKLRE